MKSGKAKSKFPGTLAEPPLSKESLKGRPAVIADAVGGVLITGMLRAMARVRVAFPVPPELMAEMFIV
jgi:hypothetical protein